MIEQSKRRALGSLARLFDVIGDHDADLAVLSACMQELAMRINAIEATLGITRDDAPETMAGQCADIGGTVEPGD